MSNGSLASESAPPDAFSVGVGSGVSVAVCVGVGSILGVAVGAGAGVDVGSICGVAVDVVLVEEPPVCEWVFRKLHRRRQSIQVTVSR